MYNQIHTSEMTFSKNKFVKLNDKFKLINLALLIVLFLSIDYNTSNAQFIQNSAQSLFSDVKAFREGDALMVFIMEDTQADNSASTTSDRSSNLGLGANLRLGAPQSNVNTDLNTNNQFSANGKTARNERIRSKLSARVIGTEPNGNLIVEGKRTTRVNGETQTITISGVVRPVDVLPNNSVYSYNVLDLSLLIEGDGSITEVQEPGLITKFLRILF